MIRAGDIASAIGAAIVPPSGLGRKPRADGSSGSAVGTAPAAIRGLHAEGAVGAAAAVVAEHAPGCAAAAAADVELSDLEDDSRRVARGYLFACIKGSRFDGHDYAQQAVEAGASALLVDRRLSGRLPVPQLVVGSVRDVLGMAAAAVHGYPSERVDLIGVTGTNGKTTTVRLIAGLLSAAGSGAVHEIGTLTGTLTTPEAPELQRRIAGAAARGEQIVAMEVSSHALSQRRVEGCSFRVAVFTNLGHDHLDYHGSREAYFNAKARLFDPRLAGQAVIDVTTPAGQRLAGMVSSRMPVTRVGEHSAEPIRTGLRSSLFRWRGQLVRLPLGGAFHLSNAVIAAETALLMGLSPRAVAEALGDALPVPGRFELVNLDCGHRQPAAMGAARGAGVCRESGDSGVPHSDRVGGDGEPAPAVGGDIKVIVDYAHTPEGIESVLKVVRPLTGGHLTVVFGAGGDRDRSKRPAMGRVAEEYADRVVLTSDNPRSENPWAIIKEIVGGMRSPPDHIEVDRRMAVRRALAGAGIGDVVVIAGKGHESVQVAAGEEREFDDRRVAREELLRLRSRSSRTVPEALR